MFKRVNKSASRSHSAVITKNTWPTNESISRKETIRWINPTIVFPFLQLFVFADKVFFLIMAALSTVHTYRGTNQENRIHMTTIKRTECLHRIWRGEKELFPDRCFVNTPISSFFICHLCNLRALHCVKPWSTVIASSVTWREWRVSAIAHCGLLGLWKHYSPTWTCCPVVCSSNAYIDLSVTVSYTHLTLPTIYSV